MSLRLQSLNQKNAHGISLICHGVFSRIRFFDFFVWFIFWFSFWFGLCLDRTNGISDGFFFWLCLHIKWFVWFGRLVFDLIYANVFFEHEICRRPTDQREVIARIWRILQVCGTCFIKDKMLDNLYLGSRKRQRLQIRLESLCIKKNKGQKNPCQRLRVHRCDPWVFFDLRSVAAGLQDEL